MLRLLIVFLVAATVSASCGGNATRTSPDAAVDASDQAPDAQPDGRPADAPPVDAHVDRDAGGAWPPGVTLGEDLADAICTKMFECCTVAEAEQRARNVRDSATCRMSLRSFFDGFLMPRIVASDAARRLDLDEAAFTACASAFRAQSCADFSLLPNIPDNKWLPDACEAAIHPLVAAGGTCDDSYECTTGRCDSVTHTCIESFPATYQPCPEGVCGPGDFCDLGDCVPSSDLGEPCFLEGECRSGVCVDRDVCAALCDGGGPGSIEPNRELEQLLVDSLVKGCHAAAQCCSADDDVGYPFNAHDEQECRFQFATNSTVVYAFSDLAVVQARGWISFDTDAARACLAVLDEPGCPAHGQLLPLVSPTVCPSWIVPLHPDARDGAACVIHQQCQSLLCEGGRCGQVPQEGQPCIRACAAGLYCGTGMVCRPQLELGSMCVADSQCANATCNGNSSMSDGTCGIICDGI